MCSEYAARFIRNAGIAAPWKHVEATTPKKINGFCLKHPELFRTIPQ